MMCSGHTGAGTVLVDLDSTLADTRPRRHLSPTVDPTKTWLDYSLGCADDLPMPGVIKLVSLLRAAGWRIEIVTGRHAQARADTIDWLRRHDVPYHRLRMREPGDPDEALDLKLAVIDDLTAWGYFVALVIDDNAAIAAALEARGHTVLCVNPRYDQERVA